MAVRTWMVLACAGALMAFIFRLAWVLGLFKPWPQNHTPGKCELIPGVEYGAEDILMLDSGIALMSSGIYDKIGLRRDPSNKSLRGGILRFNFSQPHEMVQMLDVIGDLNMDEFAPHGMGSWGPLDDGTYKIYIVNHAQHADQILIFSLNSSKTTLTLLEILESPAFGSVNDVHAIGPHNEFYFTNFRYSSNPILQEVEAALLLQWCELLYYNGNQARVVHGGYGWANGLAASPDGKYLYMAETMNSKLHVFKLDGEPGVAEAVQTIDLGSHPDNVQVSRDGDLWVGCHPLLWAVAANLHIESAPAPAQVLHLKPAYSDSPTGDEEIHWTISEVYSDDGHRVQGSSSAIRYQQYLLIGSIRRKAAVCHIGDSFLYV